MIRKSIQSLHAYVPGEQPSSPDMIKLNTNENPYSPSPAVAGALASLSCDPLRRYPDPACNALREEAANLHQCSPNQIIFGNGSDELLALCLRAFVERDRKVGFFSPSYSLYPVLANIEDLHTCPTPLPDNFGWTEPNVDGCDIFLMTTPNAPTGTAYPKDEIAEFCDSYAGVVVLDEAYADFAEENCMDLALTRKNTVVCRTLSKSYALAGIRLGYLVGPEPLVEALYKIKDSYNVNMLTQTVGLAALQDREWFNTHVELISSTRDQSMQELKAMNCTVFDSHTNFIWFSPPGIKAEELFEQLKKQSIYVRYFPGPVTGDYIRMTVGTNAEMERALGAINAILNSAS